MGAFFIVVILIVSLLIAAVVLVQNPKGGGLATGFQGASQFGGVQKTTDFLEKSTWYLTIALFVLCLGAARFVGSPEDSVDGYSEPDAPIEQPVFENGSPDLSNSGEE